MERQERPDRLNDYFSVYTRPGDPRQRAMESLRMTADEENKKRELAESRQMHTRRTILSFLLLCAALLVIGGGFFAVSLYGYNSFSDRSVLAYLTGDSGEKVTLSYVRRLFQCGVDRFVCERAGVTRVAYIEAGTDEVTVTGSDFMKRGSDARVELVCDKSSFVPSELGRIPAQLVIGRRTVPAMIEVRDTVPPSGSAVRDAEYWICDSHSPENYVVGVSDATQVTYSFIDMPERMEEGEQTFTVRLTDEGGNYTDIACPVTVFKDSEPPEIFGTEDRTVSLGSTVAYKEGIFVTDNHDENVQLEVDISNVVADVEGVYEVIYTATDVSGNSCVKTVNFTFAKSRDAQIEKELRSLVDQTLGSILTADMTQREKAKAIYDWIRGHVSYITYADKSSWKLSALNAMKSGQGSCYSYYAVSRALLDAAGIPNMMVQRAGHKSDHYWNLVNCGDGWYHFDTTPRQGGGYFFMWTDEQILAYSAKHKGSHDFDRSLYPATPLE